MATPVQSWADDYDIFDPTYVGDPFPIWDELRGSCPIAHSDRYGGSWLPARPEEVGAVGPDIEHFRSRNVSVVVVPSSQADSNPIPGGLPPITADPPVHTWARRLLLPWFAHSRVAEYEVLTRELCGRLADAIAAEGRGDAAAGYAQQIPVRVIAGVLGVPTELSDTFTGWVRDVLEFANVPERRLAGRQALAAYFNELIAERRTGDGKDLITQMLQTEVDGEPVPDEHVL